MTYIVQLLETYKSSGKTVKRLTCLYSGSSEKAARIAEFQNTLAHHNIKRERTEDSTTVTIIDKQF